MSKKKKQIISILMTLAMAFGAINLQAVGSYAAGVGLKSANKPTTITQGKKYTIKGKIVSDEKMNRVEVGIVSAKDLNKWTKYKYDNTKVKSKTFKLKKAAKTLKFNKLSPGTYYYRIYAHTDRGVYVVLNHKFKVKKKAVKKVVKKTKKATKKKTKKKVATASPSNVAWAYVVDPLTQQKLDTVKLSSYNCPTRFNAGKSYTIKGKISCSNTIKRVEAGIVVTATNKWCGYKYDARNVDAKTFDLSLAAPSLRFDRLPGGTFNYRIYVHTENGAALVFDRSFVVVPGSGPTKAIAYAKKIAANDHFTYGKGYGEFSQCCICAGKTKKKAHAKFTCMPFLAAAYCHGTGKLSMLDKDRDGFHFMHLNDKNFKGKLGEAWFKIGLCRDLSIEDLQPGDVIIKWSDNDSTGHAWMYGGGDTIIEAVPSDIRVLPTGAAGKLRNYGTKEGKPKKNYVMRFRG